jgi:hypothetical protein
MTSRTKSGTTAMAATAPTKQSATVNPISATRTGAPVPTVAAPSTLGARRQALEARGEADVVVPCQSCDNELGDLRVLR